MNDQSTVEIIPDKSATDLAREFLLGEVMSAAMKQLRAADKPWLRLPEEAQKRVIEEVRMDVSSAIKKAVELIASDARTVFRAGVESVTFKDGVKAVLTMANTEASHELADTAGGNVFVVIENPMRYTATSSAVPKAEPTQREIVAA